MSDEGDRPKATAKPSKPGVRRRSSGQMERISRGRVLIVDDDEGMLSTLERMVARGGYDVVCVTNPRLALDLCLEERPTVVLSDMDMPAMSGKELAQAIVTELGDSAPPVVILTGGEVERAACPEVAAAVRKPIPIEQLLELLGTLSGSD